MKGGAVTSGKGGIGKRMFLRAMVFDAEAGAGRGQPR